MRKHKIDKQISSNIDLTPLSNKRIKITKLEGDLYSIQSDLKLYKCEIASFIERFLDRNLTIKYVKGNCSSPSGYIFAEETKEALETVNSSEPLPVFKVHASDVATSKEQKEYIKKVMTRRGYIPKAIKTPELVTAQ